MTDTKFNDDDNRLKERKKEILIGHEFIDTCSLEVSSSDNSAKKLRYFIGKVIDRIRRIDLKYGLRVVRHFHNYIKEENYWKKKKETININGLNYYIIRRRGQAGLFSLYITSLGEIKKALAAGLIPVIDLMNYRNVYMGIEDIGSYNPWECFFIQPFGEKLQDVYKNAGTIFYCDDNDIPKERPMEDVQSLLSYNNSNNEWSRLAKKYMRVQPEISIKAQEEYFRISEGGKKKVLGVLCRGTDYTKLKPKGHPIQPDIIDITSKIDEFITKYDCQKIFVATEEPKYEAYLKAKYGKMISTIQEEKVEYKGLGYLGETIRNLDQNTRVEIGETYLIKILILAKCQYFIAGRTSGTVGVMLQQHDFRDIFLFDNGVY